jgi:hypothetical protein
MEGDGVQGDSVQGEGVVVVPSVKSRKPRRRPRKVQATAPVGEPAVENGPAIVAPPAAIAQSVPRSGPTDEGERNVEKEPAAATQLVSEAPRDDDDDGEFINIQVPDDKLDTTMATAILEMSRMSVDLDAGEGMPQGGDEGIVSNCCIYAH